MGQKHSKDRLRVIQTNVLEISNIVHSNAVNSNNLTNEDRNRYEEILQSYAQELKFILSKSVKPRKLNIVQSLIQMALQELEGINIRSTLRRIDSDINYLTRLQTKEKSLQDLDQVSKSLWALNKDLSLENFKNEKEFFNKLKHKVDSIEEVSEEVSAKKTEVFTVVSSVENMFLELEMEERVKQAEEKHRKNKVDLRRFVGVSHSKCYKNHRKFLEDLKNEVNRILEASEKIVEKKKYLLFNINNNIIALDQKVKENEEKIRKIEILSPSPNENLMEQLTESYGRFEKDFSAKCDINELRDIFTKLSEVKMKIDQKLKVLELQLCPGENRLEMVQKNVETFRKQVESCQNSEEYEGIAKKLEEYKEETKKFENGKNQDNILKYIDDVLELLEHKMSKRKSTSGDTVIDLISISASVNEFGERIKTRNFDDINTIENKLEEHLDFLQNIKLSPGKTNLCKLRGFVKIQIESHLSNLRKIKMEENNNKQFLI